jgi:RNA polymerase sigma-70 factor (ECF subfamily)
LCFTVESGCQSRYKDNRIPFGRRSTSTEELREATLMALTAALSAGDRKYAIEILWELHRDDVFRYCRCMLSDDAEASDVTQKVFEHAIIGLRRLRSVDRARSWLVGIARHRCLDHARSARRDPQLLDANALCQLAAARCVAEPTDEDPRAAKLLGECLERLDACDRALIELRYYEGLPFKEIARQLGRTPAALRVRLSRACRVLRRYLNTRLVKNWRYESPQAALGTSQRPSTSWGGARFDSSNGHQRRSSPDSAARFFVMRVALPAGVLPRQSR